MGYIICLLSTYNLYDSYYLSHVEVICISYITHTII